ncbi:MAG: YicC family protein [Chlorobiaceae bacterium]|nr:YicC family protein [Chlorobiales bacterium]NTU91663.1 YicC family protein [Chlorobiaceae bacterium]NTV26369.1 YicC family protein [Chlorobiaceae bacterium]
MLESMTGYGSAERIESGIRVLVELRSVNNRFAEISVKLPRQLLSFELEVRELIRTNFQRGKISAFVQLQLEEAEQLPLTVNKSKVSGYRKLLDVVREEAGIEAPVTLEHLLRFSEIFESDNSILERPDEIWPIARQTLIEAIESLKEMRRKEGEELAGDFTARIAEIEGTLRLIREIAADNLETIRKRLSSKISAIAGRDVEYSKDRLEMELVMAADRLDITEECIRFNSHNKFFIEELNNTASGSGRKLNFLLQEQLREANTIASKSQNADISQKVVHIKEELEKVREQLQNIE